MNPLVPAPPQRRRFTAPCVFDTDHARRVSSVTHIHDLAGTQTGAYALPRGSRGTRDESHSPSSRADRLRRLSATPRQPTADVPPSWERSLRSGVVLPPISRLRSRSRQPKSSNTKALHTRRFTAATTEEADRDSLGPSSTDSDEAELATNGSASDSRKPSVDFFIQYNRVSLRGQDEAAAAAAFTRTRAAKNTLEKLFVPVWRLHRVRSARHQEETAIREAIDYENQRTARARRDAADLIAHALNHNLLTALPFAVSQLRGAAVCIQRWYRSRSRVLDAVTYLNLRHVRLHEEKRYWDRVVIEREDALQKQADARAAALVAAAALPNASPDGGLHDISRWRGAHKRLSQPTKPVELDVYNYFLVGPLPERLLHRELRRAVVAKRYGRMGRARGALSPPPTPGARQAVKVTSTRSNLLALHPNQGCDAAPALLPHETLVAVLDNVCFLASQFRNDPMLRSHLRGRQSRILSYSDE